MSVIGTKNFHSGLKSMGSGERDIYLLGKWEESRRIIGAQLGLLCYPTNGIEIYICVSRSPDINAKDNFLVLKKDYLFYAQRDAYQNCAGIKDLLDWQMLPPGKWFLVSKADPVFIKVAVSNISKESAQYDAWVNLYHEVE